MRAGPVRDPFLSVRSTGYGTFNTLSLDVMVEVCQKIPLGTSTPACAQVAPPGPEHLLAVIPCKRDADQVHAISWSVDRKRASMRLRRVLTKVDIALPGPGFVLELPVQAFNHPTKGWCVGIATSGTTRPEVKRGSRQARPAAATPTPAAEAAPAATEPEGRARGVIVPDQQEDREREHPVLSLLLDLFAGGSSGRWRCALPLTTSCVRTSIPKSRPRLEDLGLSGQIQDRKQVIRR